MWEGRTEIGYKRNLLIDPNKTRYFEINFFWESQIASSPTLNWLPLIFKEELIQCLYNFLQFLNKIANLIIVS